MKQFIPVLILLASLCFGGAPLPAKDGAKSEDKKAAVAIPETPEALWEQIDTQRKALGDAATGAKKDDAHRAGDALAALVKALPAKYLNIAADRRRSLHLESKKVGGLCDDVQDAVNEGKADQANTILNQIDGALKFMREITAKK